MSVGTSCLLLFAVLEDLHSYGRSCSYACTVLSPNMRLACAAAVVVMTALVTVAAAAWACNPQAHIALDKTTFETGSVITIYGSYFPGAATITVSGGWGQTTTVLSSQDGGFQAQLPGPTAPGNYSIAATRPTGGFAVASFSVVQAPPQPPAPPLPPPPPPPPAIIEMPAVLGPAILRSRPLMPTVTVSRRGVVELRCGRVEEIDVSGTCGAVSRATKAGSPLLTLRPKPFRALRSDTMRVRFQLDRVRLRQIRAAGRMRMRGTVVARGALGNTSTSTFAFTLKLARRR
jgi:hypothetical protein